MRDLGRVSKLNVRKLAEDIAELSASKGRQLDPEELARTMWLGTKRCTLCSKPSFVFGVFVPSEDGDQVTAFRTGLMAGQERLVFYGLCLRCSQRADAPELVEDVIAELFDLDPPA